MDANLKVAFWIAAIGFCWLMWSAFFEGLKFISEYPLFPP